MKNKDIDVAIQTLANELSNQKITLGRTNEEKEIISQYVEKGKKRGFLGALIGGSTVAARKSFSAVQFDSARKQERILVVWRYSGSRRLVIGGLGVADCVLAYLQTTVFCNLFANNLKIAIHYTTLHLINVKQAKKRCLSSINAKTMLKPPPKTK
ncbi:unnamed protein product [Albugo candida]|uniref:Uncharacterized protein n=1 Tax=Albugo candida TaxID=65357 RepID=A0A024G7L6_9STRA|nr:unnamed protein product [Albugo candida]|eukprot:CCI42664.1 unnamed protein product [Albugo candida]